MRTVAACCWILLQLGCAPRESSRDAAEDVRAPTTSPAAEAIESVSASGDVQPVSAGEGARIDLPVPGFLPALLYVPAEPAPRPLVVASHGAGGVPEWECDYWERLTRGRAFVLCPRGARTDVRFPSGYYYPTHYALEREVVAGVRALRRRYGERVSRGAGIYAGFSQGAIMGAAMVPKHGGEFPYLVLIEGGYEYWSLARARTFARHGGRRVLFVCGTRWCAEKSKQPADWLQRSNVETRIEHAPGAGHTPAGAVMALTHATLPWVLAGDARW